MKKLHGRAENGLAAEARRFFVITADSLLGLGIRTMIDRIADCRCVGCAASLETDVAALDPAGSAGIIVDARLLPAPCGRGGCQAFAVFGGRHPVVVFLPSSGSAREIVKIADRWSVVTSGDPPEEWQAAMGAAWRGGRHLSPPALDLMAAPVRPGGGTNGDASPLSAREREVFTLTRAGLMPREIARELGRSIKTIEAHYARIKTKLGVGHMEQLRHG